MAIGFLADWEEISNLNRGPSIDDFGEDVSKL